MSTSTHCEVSTRWVLTQRNTYIYRYSNSWHIPSKTYLVPPISCWLVMAYQQRTITGSRAGDSTNLISGILPKMWVQNEYSAMSIMIPVLRHYFSLTGDVTREGILEDRNVGCFSLRCSSQHMQMQNGSSRLRFWLRFTGSLSVRTVAIRGLVLSTSA